MRLSALVLRQEGVNLPQSKSLLHRSSQGWTSITPHDWFKQAWRLMSIKMTPKVCHLIVIRAGAAPIMNIRLRLGLNVRRLRKERELSQERLSVLSGFSRAYVSSVETGRRNATLDTLEVLARTLGVEDWELIAEPSALDRASIEGSEVAPRSRGEPVVHLKTPELWFNSPIITIDFHGLNNFMLVRL
jgi:transcriptional regulator with XRE-family HTH domain